jgi:hypothetical protein
MFGIRLAVTNSMELLRTLGQIPLMFIGGLLIVVAVALVWAVVNSQSGHRVKDR